jgi:hypothetical protein
MKKLLLAGVTALFLATGAASAPDDSGNFWIPRCRAIINWADNTDPKKSPLDPYSMYAGGYCTGLIRGIIEVFNTAGIICLPNGVTHPQAMKIILAAIDRHPEILHKKFDDIITEVTLETWPPCKKPK